MNFTVDYRNFKVICQKCGKTGIINADEYVNEGTEFFRRMDYDRKGSIFREPVVDFWVCRGCMEE